MSETVALGPRPDSVGEPAPETPPGLVGEDERIKPASSASGSFNYAEEHIVAREIEIRPLWLRFRRHTTESLCVCEGRAPF